MWNGGGGAPPPSIWPGVPPSRACPPRTGGCPSGPQLGGTPARTGSISPRLVPPFTNNSQPQKNQRITQRTESTAACTYFPTCGMWAIIVCQHLTKNCPKDAAVSCSKLMHFSSFYTNTQTNKQTRAQTISCLHHPSTISPFKITTDTTACLTDSSM